jgi:capsular exopolysaccharide synthesis family protein
VPEGSIRPRKFAVLFVWLLLGFAGGVGLALLTDILEDHIAGPADIEIGIGLSVLGLVPHVKGVTPKALAMACMTNKFGQFAEAFSGIRAALDSSKYKGISQTVLISSTAPDDGKTVTASNLAIMCAKSGMHTLLVDFDMRCPSMYKFFDMPKETPSLIHVLGAQDDSEFTQLPFKSTCDGLDIIGGVLSKDLSPAEILGSRTARDFVRWAAKNYERVIIDAPPFSVVSDPMVLADLVDCVIIVCRVNRSRKRAVRHVVNRLRETGATVLGAIINDVDFKKGLYGGYYQNYYGYYNYHKYTKDEFAKDEDVIMRSQKS